MVSSEMWGTKADFSHGSGGKVIDIVEAGGLRAKFASGKGQTQAKSTTIGNGHSQASSRSNLVSDSMVSCTNTGAIKKMTCLLTINVETRKILPFDKPS